MTKETVTAKIAEHQVRIDALNTQLQNTQAEILQRQGAVIALNDLLAEAPLEAVPDPEPAQSLAPAAS